MKILTIGRKPCEKETGSLVIELYEHGTRYLINDKNGALRIEKFEENKLAGNIRIRIISEHEIEVD